VSLPSCFENERPCSLKFALARRKAAGYNFVFDKIVAAKGANLYSKPPVLKTHHMTNPTTKPMMIV
jgi:hypothetical protein